MNFVSGSKTLLVLSILSTLAPGDTSWAQSSAAPDVAGQVSPAQVSARDMRASEIIGMQVRNAQGKELGKIEDVVIDIDRAKAHYAILAFGGTLGLGKKQVAFPFNSFTSDGKRGLVLNASEEQLRNAPAFERQRHASYGSHSFLGVDRFLFKEDTTRYTPNGSRLMNASDLINKDINDHAAHNAGQIADLVIHLGDGAAYAVMKADVAGRLSGKFVPLPMSALTIPSRPDLDLILNVDRNKIAAAIGFDKDIWQNLNAPGTQQKIRDQLLSLRAQSQPNAAAAQSGQSTSSGASR